MGTPIRFNVLIAMMLSSRRTEAATKMQSMEITIHPFLKINNNIFFIETLNDKIVNKVALTQAGNQEDI